MECKCGHDSWDHEVEEQIHEDGDESLYFLKCEVEGCDCDHYREKEDE